MRVYLDPDYRKLPDMKKPYCVRCQRPLKVNKAITVTLSSDGLYVVSLTGPYLLGKDCWKKISKTKEY